MTDQKLRGAALLATAVNHILAHPETWDQQEWHCGTKHCIAGHCELLATGKETRYTSDIAQELLGITVAEADWLFDARRTLREIYGFAEAMLSDTRFDRWGYDREGRDRRGYPLPPLVIPATE